MSTTTKCDGCGKDEVELGKTLKQCAKCGSARYCSRECQKTDWKEHKKVCSSNAGSRAANAAPSASNNTSADRPGPAREGQRHSSSNQNLDTFVEKPFTKLHTKTWLHDRSEKDGFKLLIDSYRMRMEDMYKFGEPEADSLYSGAPNGQKGFRRFLRLAEAKPNLLSAWWSPSKNAECMEFGKTDNQHGLEFVIEKSDIVEYYGNNDMPMQLRMFAEQVYWTGPGGQSGARMLAMRMALEGEGAGGMHYTQLDISPSVVNSF